MTLYADRRSAGRVLAESCVSMDLPDPVVLALPRGGVPVGLPVARALGAPFDVYVARKIGLPWRPELGVGAVAEDGQAVFDHLLLRQVGLEPDDLEPVVTRERAEARRRVERYRGGRSLPPLAGRTVVLVDDGLATGATARAAFAALRPQRPGRLVFAAPVCAVEPARALASEVDAVICPHRPESFVAVGQWYGDFAQVTDDEVVALLAEGRRTEPAPGR
jgi:putative phosphoribosyl transferase